MSLAASSPQHFTPTDSPQATPKFNRRSTSHPNLPDTSRSQCEEEESFSLDLPLILKDIQSPRQNRRESLLVFRNFGSEPNLRASQRVYSRPSAEKLFFPDIGKEDTVIASISNSTMLKSSYHEPAKSPSSKKGSASPTISIKHKKNVKRMDHITEEEDNSRKVKLRAESGKSLKISGRPNSEPNVKLSKLSINSQITANPPTPKKSEERERDREKEKVIPIKQPDIPRKSSPLKSIFKIKMKRDINITQTQPQLQTTPSPTTTATVVVQQQQNLSPTKLDLRKSKEKRPRARSTPKTARDNNLSPSSKKVVLKPHKKPLRTERE